MSSSCSCEEIGELRRRVEALEKKKRGSSGFQECMREARPKFKDLPPQAAFCAAAKLCSGKAKDEEEALKQCTRGT